MNERKRVMDQANRIGPTAPMQYWNDVVSTFLSVAQEQAGLYAGLWQRGLTGATDAGGRVEDLRDVWASSFEAWSAVASFPGQWCMRWTGGVPTVTFVLDAVASASTTATVTSPVNVRGLTVRCTDLVLLGTGRGGHGAGPDFAPGAPTMPAAHVLVNPSPLGDRVSFQLADLPPRPAHGPAPSPTYHYQGAVFAQERQTFRPVATIQVVFLPAAPLLP